jgi:hypothetical protein
MEKLTKEELVGDLLMNGHIDAEEAITLLRKAPSVNVINPYNYITTRT